VSEFDHLKNEAEQMAQQHPEQIKEGEDAVEKKFGMGQQDQSGQGGPQDQYGALYANHQCRLTVLA
jgi:hypothetical protein